MTGAAAAQVGSTRENLPPPPFQETELDDSAAMSALEGAFSGDPDNDTSPPAPQPDSPAPKADDGAPPEKEAPADDKPEAEPPPETAAPLEPPRSWSKEARAHWQTLPPATQEYVLQRETERDAELRRGQNEAAERVKAIEAERVALATERQRYAKDLPAILAAATAQLQSTDYARLTPQQRIEMAATDPGKLKYLEEVHNVQAQQVREIAAQNQQIQERAFQEQKAAFEKWEAEQTEIAKREVPEFFDEKTGQQRSAQAKAYLSKIGYSPEEIAQLRDSRQLMILRDALYGREARDKAAIAARKVQNVPPVSRPGTVSDAPGQGMSAQKRTALLRQLSEEQSTEAQAALLEQFL